MKKFQSKAAVILSILTAASLTACSSKSEDTLSSNKDADAETVVVGTGNAYEPYCYLDENGNLAGYEYEVLKAVDELLLSVT